MPKEILDGTGLLSNAGALRLSPDLAPESAYVRLHVNKQTSELHILPADKNDPGALKVSFPRPGIPKISIRKALPALGLTRYEVAGLYAGKKVGSAVILDMRHKLRADENGQLRAWNRRRWSIPFPMENSAIRKAFKLARRETDENQIWRLCQREGVRFDRVLSVLLDPSWHGCVVRQRGDKVRLFTPSEAKKMGLAPTKDTTKTGK